MTTVPYAITLLQDNVEPLVTDADAESESDDDSNMDNDGGAYLPRVYDNEKDEELSNDGYNATFMEEDGTYDVDHVCSYIDLLTKELDQPDINMYNSIGPCLKRGIAEKVINAMDTVAIFRGMDYNFFNRITAKEGK